MQLYYIRHAQSQNNALWSETGSEDGRSEDPEITDLGRKQAELLAEYLAVGDPRGGSRNGSAPRGFGITHLYSSLMVRSVKTGSIISSRLGLPLTGWQEVHERGGIYRGSQQNGEVECLPGKDRAYFEMHYPEFILPESFIETGWWNRQPVETDEVCQARAKAFLHGLVEKHGGTDDRVAVVSHGGFYNDFLWALMGLPFQEGTWFLMYNTAISRVDFLDNHVRLAYQNRSEHLPPELLT